MLFKRFSVIICPFLIFLGLELLFYTGQNLSLIVLILSSLFILWFLILKYLIKEKIISLGFWGLAILPLLLYLSTACYLMILGWGFYRHIVIILLAVILAAYLESIFLYFYYQQGYHKDSLDNSSVFLNILIFFLMILNLNAINIFLNLPFWLLSLILIAVLSLILGQYFWVTKQRGNLRLVYILIINLLILEFFWALSFLPSNLYVHSIILTIIYYFIYTAMKMRLADIFDKKLFWRYLMISAILLLIVIFTSRWS
ncbi:MAG: hypothetical protein NT116_04490 [Candidatus Parcubacteria bacterium]|nr:hypothetical protein [Candidatus Parcubacteria bacterium]